MDNILIFRKKYVSIEVGDYVITRFNDIPREVVDIAEKYGFVTVLVKRPEPYTYGGPILTIYQGDIKKVIKRAKKELL